MDVNIVASSKQPQVAAVTEAASAKAQPQAKQQQQIKPQLVATDQSQSGDSNDSITISAPMPDKAIQIREINDVRNITALSVSATDQKLTAVTNVVDKMKGSLAGIIVKNFPPFPAECSERKQLLMSYLSLQKELMQLTVPPPPAPVYEKVKHQWADIFTNNSPSQSKLPVVAESTTSDSGLNAAIGVLNKLSDGISSIRETVKQTLTGN